MCLVPQTFIVASCCCLCAFKALPHIVALCVFDIAGAMMYIQAVSSCTCMMPQTSVKHVHCFDSVHLE